MNLRCPASDRLMLLCLAALVATCSPRADAAVTAEQRTKIAACGRDILAAEKAAKTGDAKQSAPLVAKAQAALVELYAGGDRDVLRAIDPLRKRVEVLRTPLLLEGLDIPPFNVGDGKPDDGKPDDAKPDDGKPDAAKPATPAAPADGKISFVKQVAPMLVAKCGRCHVDDSKGKFNMATFAALAKGSKDGRVIFPKDGKSSRIVELIEQGDMPRGGAKVTAAELAALVKWIDEGANFDGGNLNAPIKSLIAGAAAAPAPAPAAVPEMPKLDVVQATGKETSSWSRDVAAVVAESCMGCHGERQPRGQFSMATFETFLRGGQGGRVIVPGKPAESLLIKKLKGQSGAQMPLRLPPLSSELIARIEKWIADGAKFDGPSPKSPTAQVAELYVAKHATHEDLSKSRAALAESNWRLASPGEENKPTIVSTGNFLVYGKTTEAVLKEVADTAEAQLDRVAKALKAPADKPLIKGRTTLYVFKERYDYGEYGRMVEKRQIPNAWYGHWGYNVTDAYACVLMPGGGFGDVNEPSLDLLLAQQLASIYIASQGAGIPRWFAEGSGRAVVEMLDSRDLRVKNWDGAVAAIVSGSPRADAFMTGGLPPEEADVASYAFIKDVKPGGRNYEKLLDALRAGQPLDRAWLQVYRGTPQQAAQAWAVRVARGR
ncbi:MAG: c-type cytochrome domain-containing protein [Pirellulales bacterium]